jgi:uncharacterized protein (TIGR02231 family)
MEQSSSSQLSLNVPDRKDKDKKHKDKSGRRSHRSESVSTARTEITEDILSKQTGIVHNKGANDCPIEFVTVYSDRAEVTRRVNAVIEREGVQQIVIGGLSEKVDSNSVRVSGGAGKATILEVSYENKHHSIPGETPSQLLLDEQKKLDRELQKLQTMKTRIEEQRKWLKNYSEGKHQINEHNKMNLDDVAQFMKFYLDNLNNIDTETEKFDRDIEELQQKRNKLNTEISAKQISRSEYRREITITVYAPGATDLILQVSYMVLGASFNSSYDVRVSTKSGTPTCQLHYYGVITNATGEDWKDVNMSLSTAKPSLGGHPPDLPTSYVKYREEVPVPLYSPAFQRRYSTEDIFIEKEVMIESKAKRPSYKSEKAKVYRDSDSEDDEDEMSDYAPPINVMTTRVEAAMGSATYHIPRACSVAADNKPHKVSVILLDLTVDISYVSIPVLAARAYMKAMAKNTSQYQLLPGSINVFLDNIFLTQSSLKFTNPGEEFELYLGVDESIKVELKPAELVKGKTGIIKKTRTHDMKNWIVIKNTKTTPVKINVKDQLPLSNNEQIKVKLNEPQVVKGNNAFMIDENNHLVWNITIEGGKETRLAYHYTIEYPAEKEIAIV